MPYPVGQFPELWPPSVFTEVTDPFYQCPLDISFKELCCYGFPWDGTLDCINMTVPITPLISNSNSGSFNSSSVPSFDNDTVEPFQLSGNNDPGNFVVSPNPFSAQVKVQWSSVSNVGNLYFKLMNLNGQIIREIKVDKKSTAGELLLNTSNLSPGVYILEYHDKEISGTTKIVKVGR